jgi:hypothetical protein
LIDILLKAVTGLPATSIFWFWGQPVREKPNQRNTQKRMVLDNPETITVTDPCHPLHIPVKTATDSD